ncbi:MAG: hypothetical protein FJ297_06775 [Planctomycetes bacterium]|nr:hypothetical protein [Planctomycetota bacterium]
MIVVRRLGGISIGMLGLWTALFGAARAVEGQVRVRLPDGGGAAPIDSGSSLAPVPFGGLPAGASLGQPSLDPYTTTSPGSSFGSIFGGTSAPPQPPPAYGGLPPPGTAGPAATAPWGPAPWGSTPSSSPSLFPNGIGGSSGTWGSGQTISGTPLRFLQGPRFKHAWLAGDDGRELDINETDVSVVLTWPNFFYSTQPLYVAPSFGLDLWDNPEGPTFPPGADLPAQAYSAFLDTFWRSDPARLFGADIGVRVGVWSDFQTFTTDSIRIQGLGLGRLKVTPTLTVRAGVMYVDRAKIKVIPAGGVLWEPNAQTRWDFFFPQPKFANYLTTLGNQDVWWYIAGEYGGDSWTIERAIDGGSDRVDLNDIRLTIGLEWGAPELFREGRRLGFAEVGWVTEREAIYVRRPEDDFTVRDTIMLRAGIGY